MYYKQRKQTETKDVVKFDFFPSKIKRSVFLWQ